MLSETIRWTTQLVGSGGYCGLAALLAFENIFLPLPSELVLPLVGFLASQGKLAFFGAVAASTIGSAVGALILYGIGRWYGEERLRSLVARRGGWILLSTAQLDRASGWFARNGRTTVLVGRCVPGLRSLVSIPAGIQRMPLCSFVLLTLLGSAVWNAALIGLGWWLREQWTKVGEFAGLMEAGVWITVGLAIATLLLRGYMSRSTAAPAPLEIGTSERP